MKLVESKIPYQEISYDDLFLYVLYIISASSKKLEWQDIVIASFQLFPKRFGLPHFENEYPDSAQVDRSLLRCRDKRLINGRRSQGYLLTTTGLEVAQNLAKKIEAMDPTSPRKTVKMHEKSKAGKIVTHISNSSAFKKYASLQNKKNISEYDVCSMLLCTLDAPIEVKTRNLQSFKDEAESGRWNDVVEFLTWTEKNFPNLFGPKSKKRRGIYG